MFDSSLRTPVVYAIAIRYQTPLWRAGAMLRAGCMAGFWVLLLWFPHQTWPKGVRDPVALPKMLAHEEPFDQAIVDLRYAQSAATGLTALVTLRDLAPGTKTIISTTDEEENRLLYLLAAFQFFEPKAMLAKRADAFVTRAVVEAIGRTPTSKPGDRPLKPITVQTITISR